MLAEINIPQIQRLQRLRIDQTQKSQDDQMLNHIQQYLQNLNVNKF